VTWFATLTGFAETSPQQVRQHLILEGETLTSQVNGRTWHYGRLDIPTLGELRGRVAVGDGGAGRLAVREVVADVQALHADGTHAGALFQVASQFNLLEMTSPHVTPEQGVGIYEHDPTQGPACAIAAGAGTIYRNYFVPLPGQLGQSAQQQLDCLADLGAALGNTGNRLWEMRNGYALASESGLREITQRLAAASEPERDALRQQVHIGIQWATQVTLAGATHRVTQAYCAALPVAYSSYPPPHWEAFARLVLEAAYEATLCAAILNGRSTGNQGAFLTLLGGGAFGNAPAWILDSLKRALHSYAAWDLDLAIVSYRCSNPQVQMLVAQFA